VSRRGGSRLVGRGSAPSRPSAPDWIRWGVDPAWSRIVPVHGHDGVTRDWHVLERPASPDVAPLGTIVCVHGNPTWSYLWRSFLHRFPAGYRVIAVDQLGMGYSERTEPRRYATRVRDLADLVDTLVGDAEVIVAGQDWGGAMVMGWAVANRARVRGLILCNTGIAIPAGTRGPAVIRLASKMTGFIGHRTRIFVDGTVALGRDRISSTAREAYRAPYRDARYREAIGEFVADAPFGPSHPSATAIAEVAAAVSSLTCPVLLAFGSHDPVFGDRFADDLFGRMPHADRHRFSQAGHLVIEEADVASVAERWLHDRFESAPQVISLREAPSPAAAFRPVWAALAERADDTDERADDTTRADDTAHADDIAYADGATGTEISFSDLRRKVDRIATGLAARGLKPGDRVAVLVPPSIDLLTTVYAVWRAGGITVIADRGLGLGGLGRAVRSARVSWIIGTRQSIAAARTLRWAGGAKAIDVREYAKRERDGALPDAPLGDHDAAILFTSGATGPAKGVRYTHGALAAQRDALAITYGITPTDRLVAAFAPFALFGPALGIASATPDCDVTKPGQLTAATLFEACNKLNATMAFASPAALANVLATNAGVAPLTSLRVVMSAGAPVPAETLTALQPLAPNATFHTPYGMTEALPVCDIDLTEIVRAEERIGRRGVCVGQAVHGAEIMIAPLSFDSAAPITAVPVEEMGEIMVRAPWLSAGYNGLWLTETNARPTDAHGRIWHRSGDVGHIDDQGRLWVEGRSVHVISTANGVQTPVPLERQVEATLDRTRVAAVGVGPVGVQVVVIVVENRDGDDGLADATLARKVRVAVAPQLIAAVLQRKALPVDIRHNAKIDRTAVAAWAGDVLAGGGT
jgi:olefin beta-lactone synthetase